MIAGQRAHVVQAKTRRMQDVGANTYMICFMSLGLTLYDDNGC